MAYLPEFVDRSVPATARVEESDDAIRISIVGEGPPASSMVATPGVVEMSPDILMGARRPAIGLAQPVSGRRIEGPEVTFGDGRGHGVAAYRVVYDEEGRAFWVVPRVVGLSPHDAGWVLSAQGFEPEAGSPLGRQTTGQDPLPDTIATGQHGTFHGKVNSFWRLGGLSRRRASAVRHRRVLISCPRP